MNAYSGVADRVTRTPKVSPVWTLDGFGPMMKVSTSFGDVPAQVLRERDQVRTATGGFSPIAKVNRYVLEADIFNKCPDAVPILIRAGALGPGLPKHDIMVSPRQKLAVGQTAIGARFFEAADVLNRPGVMRKPEAMFTYTRFECTSPVVVKAEGIWAKVEPSALPS